jgi:hypothetical protein
MKGIGEARVFVVWLSAARSKLTFASIPGFAFLAERCGPEALLR